MQIPTWLYILVMLGAVGGYYWFKVGRHGGSEGYQKYKFGLREGEKPIQMFAGSFIPEKDLKQDIGLALVGMQRVGKALTIVLTDRNRLILAYTSTNDPTLHLERDQVRRIQKTGDVKLPPRSAIEMELTDGQKINLHVDPNAVGPLSAWAS